MDTADQVSRVTQAKPPLLKNKGFWDRIEIASAYLGATSSILGTLSSEAVKFYTAVFTAIFLLIVAISKLQSKHLEEAEKQEKASRDAQIESERAQEAATLKSRHEKQAQRVVSRILKQLRDRYFEKENDDEKYKHRVTLFVCNGPPNTRKRLCIYARDGVHLDSTCYWHIDDNDPKKCRGIAGKIWFNKTSKIMTAECDWPHDDDPSQKARYAKSLGISVEEAERLNVKSRVFAGTPIMVRGQSWGVLLLDSRNANSITDDNPHKRTLINQYSKLIAAVLEEVES